MEVLRNAVWHLVTTRPPEGGPATRNFVMDGRDAVTRTVSRRRGDLFRLVVPGADGARVRGIRVAVDGRRP